MPDHNDPNDLTEPTPDEEAAAERAAEDSPEIEQPYREMTERGATHEGEGKIS